MGHAIETAGKFRKYNHGEAVALGMILASDISAALGLLSQKTFGRIESLIGNVGLPLELQGVSIEGVIKAHYYDKKFTGMKNKFVLIQDIGRSKVVEEVPLEIIKAALRKRT